MRIGIDFDGVIFDTEKAFRIASEIYEVQELKQNTIKDNRQIRCQERYSWSEEEIKKFFEIYHEKIIRETNYIVGAREILSLLKKERTYTYCNNSKRRDGPKNH